MRVAIGSDHAGFELKEILKPFLADRADVLDVGTYSRDAVDYADSAAAVGTALREQRADRGIVLCGSGVGASMAANRMPGIRAAVCHDTYSAHQGVEHDDMNVLVLGGRVVGSALACDVVDAFLRASFSGDARHVRRLAKVTALENPLRALPLFGHSVWLDNIRRSLITSGELRRLIDEDGVRGLTSNPAIFDKAISGSSEYRDLLEAPGAALMDPMALYERLAIRDIQDAADLFKPVYLATARRDGYVSLEVSPLLAADTGATLGEARRLWRAVNRANLMIKIPGTPAGIPAIRQLIAEGINVNVTLLFAQQAYECAAAAYLDGLEALVACGGDPSTVASVASFFVSRIDTAIDAALDTRLAATADAGERRLLQSVRGRVAIANAKLAYQRYQQLFSGDRWGALAARGAQTQRLLWASTGTKNPHFRDVLYVEELIGPDTVNTMPPATLEAFRDHGCPRESLTEDTEGAHDTLLRLATAGMSLSATTDALLADGVELFADAFRGLLDAVDRQSRGTGAERIRRRCRWSVAPAFDAAVAESLGDWQAHGKVRRLWARDPTLWTGRDESKWLGWLDVVNRQLADVRRFAALRDDVQAAGISDVLLLGMGGSSLCPEVLRLTFGRRPGFPALHVLDSTDPAQVAAIEQRIDPATTLFIVSSKSGTTLEPHIFMQYFFERVAARLGRQEAARRFVAITDPGSTLQERAKAEGFRHVYEGRADIGGRYSALSDFGLVPAAIIGVDVAKFLARAEEMVAACAPSAAAGDNPGVVLGTILGVAATRFGRDKLTMIVSPSIASLGAWLEQLVCESTGKDGTGIIPIDREPLGAPEAYGRDRLFVYTRLRSAFDPAQDTAVAALERAGHPVVRLELDDAYDLGQEFFRWEIATAVAGAILGIHPFDQPDVEASKVATRRLTAEYERTGALPPEAPLCSDDDVALFADARNADALNAAVGERRTLASYLAAHVARLTDGD
ncbi:MAG TPA: bifunctional transaldolase/phosoglucose isomerase, partial [Vicinamibacterales bacterium]|nr:bifunctional transaldolase/phosoglucose isomerase [Vicinamibacterales bacterium]